MAKKKDSADAAEVVVEATATDSKKAAKPVKWFIKEAAAKRKEKK